MEKQQKNGRNPAKLGIVGLGTMGRNLLLNMNDHSFAVVGLDMDEEKVKLLEEDSKGTIAGFTDVNAFVGHIGSPKIILLLVPAGKIVDSVINELKPLLTAGDLIIDGGNSHMLDTERRGKALESAGIHFFGMGISGGEKGARFGPSLMPGGDKNAYQSVRPILEAISAKVSGAPCVAYMGNGAAGHFVKMVHNGIEYALMQGIAESYDIMKNGLKFSNDEMHQVFLKWNDGKLKSYLMEITSQIFVFKEEGTSHLLLDVIQDVARSKGTGKWTSQIAMDLNVPIPTIDTAVSMRDLSKFKHLREQASQKYTRKEGRYFKEENKFSFIDELEEAFYFFMITVYAQGMHLLHCASTEYDFELDLSEIAKIWRGGCIIRSHFLNQIYKAYEVHPSLTHLFLNNEVSEILKENLPSMQSVVISAISHGLAIPALVSSLSYFDSLRTENSPANLIQAQRDFFGAHTYERVGLKGTFHTEWE